MKRTLDQIRAFELAKAEMPDLQLKIAGGVGGKYGKKVLEAIKNSPYADDIEYLGRISTTQKLELLQRSHLITVTSVKEGWGLIVTEAASQGTPAAVYNVDGLRDSVQHGKTGTVCAKNTPAHLARSIVELLSDTSKYRQFQKNAWEWSKQINFETSYEQFSKAVES
jgi:glycosyltransferase involved in cell wall biosynthesis